MTSLSRWLATALVEVCEFVLVFVALLLLVMSGIGFVLVWFAELGVTWLHTQSKHYKE